MLEEYGFLQPTCLCEVLLDSCVLCLVLVEVNQGGVGGRAGGGVRIAVCGVVPEPARKNIRTCGEIALHAAKLLFLMPAQHDWPKQQNGCFFVHTFEQSTSRHPDIPTTLRTTECKTRTKIFHNWCVSSIIPRPGS